MAPTLTVHQGEAKPPLQGQELLEEVYALLEARLPLLSLDDPVRRVLAPIAAMSSRPRLVERDED